MLKKISAAIVSYISPLQLGVGIAGAIVKVAWWTRTFASSLLENEGILQLDFANAFNTLDRTRVTVPQLFPCPHFAYASASHLFIVY